MASQTEVLKALHEDEGANKPPDLAKRLKTSEDTVRALMSKLKKKALVDGDAKGGWYITDAGIKTLEAGEKIPTTITDVGEDELSKFKYYGQLNGVEPNLIEAAAELFQNLDMRSMEDFERVMVEMNIPLTQRGRWTGNYRGFLRNTTVPEQRDELYPLPMPSATPRVSEEGATATAEKARGDGFDYIVEGNEIHRVGDGLGEFNFRQALQVVAARRGSAPKAEADGSLTGALNAFAEALKSTSPSQPLTVQDVLNIINTMKENSGEASSAPGYVDEDGEWHELRPGQPVILKRSKESPSTGKTLVIKQTPEGIVTEEHQAGSPIIINANPPPANTGAPATAMPPMMPFPVIGGDGKPVVDQDGHPVYANIEPMLKWLGFQSEQRRADERHSALMGLAQAVRENLGDGIQALKAAAQEIQKTGKQSPAQEAPPAPQAYECGQCKTKFTIPTTEGWTTLKCPNPTCGKTWTRQEVLGHD